MPILKYIGSIINLANSFSKATRPKSVGQLSELIQEYRSQTDNISIETWKEFYINKIGSDKIETASEKNWEYIKRIRENLNQLTEKDVYDWTNDLIINKTFSGLQIQLDVLRQLAKNNYRLASPEEEKKGIDGFIDEEPVSIKPISYKNTIQSNKENILYKIVYYKQTKDGLQVITN